MLRVKLRHLEAWNGERAGAGGGLHAALAGVPGLVLPRERRGARSAWHLYTLRAAGPRRLAGPPDARGIATAVHYPRPIHLQPAWPRPAARRATCRVSERLSREVMSLPLYPELPLETLERIAREIRAFCGCALSGGRRPSARPPRT